MDYEKNQLKYEKLLQDVSKKLLAVGGTADIYDLGNGKVFKRFHEDKPEYCIENEIECTSSEVAVSLGAPKVYERVNDERGRGIIMEYVSGQSMLEEMFLKGTAFDIEKNAEEMAKLQYKINSFDGTMFPKGHDVMRERILQSGYLDDTTKAKLLKLLETLPQGNGVCHSDMHPGNIIVTENGFRVIDWCDTMCDSVWLDVARTLLIFESVSEMPGVNTEDLNKSRYAWKTYYRTAFEKIAGKSEEELEGWMAVVAAVRLAEERPENHPWMMGRIKRAVDGI